MAAQKATDLRRLLSEVEANEKVLRQRQDELEAHLLAAAATTSPRRPRKAVSPRALSATLTAEDARRRKLVAAVLKDFDKLDREP